MIVDAKCDTVKLLQKSWDITESGNDALFCSDQMNIKFVTQVYDADAVRKQKEFNEACDRVHAPLDWRAHEKMYNFITVTCQLNGNMDKAVIDLLKEAHIDYE